MDGADRTSGCEVIEDMAIAGIITYGFEWCTSTSNVSMLRCNESR